MRDRERKRKRELGIEDEDGDDDRKLDDGTDDLGEGEGHKRQKQEAGDDAAEARRRAKSEKKKEKREKKREKIAKKKAKDEAKKAAKQDIDLIELQEDGEENEGDHNDLRSDGQPINHSGDMGDLDVSGLVASDKEDRANDDPPSDASSVPTTPVINSPAFDLSTNHSETSSSSSIAPPSLPDQATQTKPETQKPRLSVTNSPKESETASTPRSKPVNPRSGTASPKIVLPNIDKEQLQERLRQRIEALRAQRKADGPDGNPVKSRQELLEQRRKKEEQRKAHKKELRRQSKEEEAQRREEQLRGSGSPLSADIFSPRSPRPQENNFSFSRLAFDDGTSADASLTSLSDPKKPKGPQDPRTALEAAEKKQARLAGYDAAKRADIAEKDLWLHAKQRAHGERVRDDTSLLKKALKRQEKQKGKSEREWREREEAVVKGKEARQKKRDNNLLKRREGKGNKGKKKTGPANTGKGKKKARPGFEGRFKA